MRKNARVPSVGMKRRTPGDEESRSRRLSRQNSAEAALRKQVEFEKLVATISRLFLKSPPEEVDRGINKALQLIGEFDGVDRSYLYLVSSDLSTIEAGYEWCAPEIKSELEKSKTMSLTPLSWSREQLLTHEALHVPRVSALPPEANCEKAEFVAQGIQSLLLVPLIADPFFGFLGFDAVRAEKTWPDESITLLKIVREVITQALHRKRAEQLRRDEARVPVALARVGRELIGSLRAPAILDRLCQVTAEVLASDYSHTYLWNPREEAYTIAASWGESPEQMETFRVFRFSAPQVQGLIEHFQQEDALDLDIEQLSRFLLLPLEFFVQRGVTRAIYMALREGTEIVGAQTASYRGRQEPCSPQQLHIARGIAQLASLALGNARLLEETEQVNRLKSDFLATMSHELRTPLNIILGYTEMLLDDGDSLSAMQGRLLKRIGVSAKELLELINATLDVSRFEAGRLPVDLQEVELTAFMAELQRETATRPVRPGVVVEWQAPSSPLSFRTDQTKLKVVIKNLLGNALKFTEQGTIKIEAHAAPGGVEFTVSDTGIGIPTEILPVIFDMFRQGDSAEARNYGGVGLGLYIVRRLLDLVGGTVAVESTLGRGSTFRVWLPN